MARGWFYRLRVTALSSLLALVCLWACQDVRARRARTEWHTPVSVGLVILRHGDVDARALASLQQRARALEERLSGEFQRYRSAPAQPMIQIVAYGPVSVSEPPPEELGVSFWARALHTYRMWRYTSAVDEAAGVPTRALDARIYVVAEPPHSGTQNFVEGFSEERGRVGVARVDLNVETVDLALFVVAHELLHTLGATDKYDAVGRTSIPAGLPEPELLPQFPQRYAEVMARNRVVSATLEVPPQTLGELRVGRVTAEEIGWLR